MPPHDADAVLAGEPERRPLVVKVNGYTVTPSPPPQEGESALKFFARVARANQVKNFDVETDADWDEEDEAVSLTGTFNIKKVDKPGC